MSGKASKRVCFTPDDRTPRPVPVFLKNGAGARSRKRVALIFSFSAPKSSNFSLLRRIGAKLAGVVRFMSMRRKVLSSSSSSRKVSASSVSSSSSTYTLTRSRSLADAIDSQRAEAIEDCIEFLNSSSCYLPRSNSVSTNSCYN